MSHTLPTEVFSVLSSPPDGLSATSVAASLFGPSPSSDGCFWSLSPSTTASGSEAASSGTVATAFSVDSALDSPSFLSVPLSFGTSPSVSSVRMVSVVLAVSTSSGTVGGLSSMTAFSTATFFVPGSPDALSSGSCATVVVTGTSSATVVVVLASELMMICGILFCSVRARQSTNARRWSDAV